MCHNHTLQIEDNSIFVADVHYNSNRTEFKKFLLKLQSGDIETSQLFLMGDIFDFLAEQIDYFVEQNQEIIDILNNLSKKIQIIYFEGNHDFNISNLFDNIKVISRKNQPLIAQYKHKKISLAHGDIFTPIGYEIYTKILRSPVILSILNIFDIGFFISKKVNIWLKQKDICSKDSNDNFINSRVKKYNLVDVDMIIEGHFHYGYHNDRYYNIPSFACDKSYFIFSTENRLQLIKYRQN